MRVHLTFHEHPDALAAYIPRAGAELIGGTLPFTGDDRAVRTLWSLAGKEKGRIIHITMSLPKEFEASREEWLAILEFVLAEKGLPPRQTPWFALRHRDTDADHVHLAAALRTFAGRPLEPVTSKEKTDRLHEDLAARVGLPVPAYFRADLGPRLVPTTPARRLNTLSAEALYEDLQAVFRRWQPRNFDELRARMSEQPGGFKLTLAGGVSYLWESARYGTLHGSELGEAWKPRHVRRRLEHALALRVLRPRLQLRRMIRALSAPPYTNTE